LLKSLEQPGWNLIMDKILLDLTVVAYKQEEDFSNWNKKKPPLKTVEGWEILAGLFNKQMNPHGVYVQQSKTATELNLEDQSFIVKTFETKLIHY